MYAAFYLLTIVGLVGAYDVFFYHMYKLQLYKQRAAMWENVTHFIRALLFAVMLLVVLHVRADGWWWFVYPVLLGFELTNTMIDVAMEPRTRRTLGGLPPMEYILHMFLGLATGAALASIIWGTYDRIWLPTALSLETLAVEPMMLLGAYTSIVTTMIIFTFELVNFVRMFRNRHAAAANVARPSTDSFEPAAERQRVGA